MSQSLPVLTGSGSLLGIAESQQSSLAAGVKGVGAEGGFSAVMSKTAVPQKVAITPENETGGEALPSGGAELPPDAVQGDGGGQLNGANVAVTDGAASVAEGGSPSQTVEQIERFLAVELNVEHSRSEFIRPEVVKQFASIDMASQSNLSTSAVVSPAGDGLGKGDAVWSLAEVGPVKSSSQGEVKNSPVVTDYSAGLSQQVIDVVQGVQRESVDGVKQSPLSSGVGGSIAQVAGVEAVKAPFGIDPEVVVNNAAPANELLTGLSVPVESKTIPAQAGVGQQSVSFNASEYAPAISPEKAGGVAARPEFADPAELRVSVVDSEEAKASVVPLAMPSVVAAGVAGERLKLSAEQSAGRDGMSGRAPLEVTPVATTGATVNAPEGGVNSNSSLADRLARLQSVAGSQVEPNQLQKDANLSAVDKVVQDKGGVEPRNESALEALAASMAATTKAAKPQSDVLQLQMPNGLKPGMQAWNQAVNERIVLLPSQNGRIAEIQLDPPELGALQVKLQVKNDQVSVVFSTPHGTVRDALEQGMPRLREMFAEQGLSLTDSSVEDQSTGGNREDSSERQGTFAGNSGLDEEVDSPMTAASQSAGLSLVDYYA